MGAQAAIARVVITSQELLCPQATLFNRPRTGFSVLAASDAVGMGLNLNIRWVAPSIFIEGLRRRHYCCLGPEWRSCTCPQMLQKRFPPCRICQRGHALTMAAVCWISPCKPPARNCDVLIIGAVIRRRIVFTSMEKFDGSSFRPLTAAEVKQIAGRAGRFGSSYGRGGITCMHQVMAPYCCLCWNCH